MTTVTLPANPH